MSGNNGLGDLYIGQIMPAQGPVEVDVSRLNKFKISIFNWLAFDWNQFYNWSAELKPIRAQYHIFSSNVSL